MDINKIAVNLSVVLLSLVLIIVIAHLLGFDLLAVLRVISSLSLEWVAILFLITFLELILKTSRFAYSLKTKRPFSSLLHAYFTSVFLSFLIPFRLLGEGVRPLAFRSISKISYRESLSAISIERVMDMLVLPTVLLLMFTSALNPLAPTLILLFLLVFIFLTVRGVFTGVIRKLPFGKTSSFFEDVFENIRNTFSDKGKMFAITLTTLAVWMLAFLRFWLITKMLGENLSFTEVAFVSAFTYLFSIFSLLPGGLVMFEGGGVAALLYFGVDKTNAFTATMLERIFSYWLFILGGIVDMAFNFDNHLNRK